MASNERLESQLLVVDRVHHWCRHNTPFTSDFNDESPTWELPGPRLALGHEGAGTFSVSSGLAQSWPDSSVALAVGVFQHRCNCIPDDGMDLGLFMFMCSKSSLLIISILRVPSIP
jgi:hypothetical protein